MVCKKSFCAHIGKSESDGQNNASVAAQANDWPGTMFGESEKVFQRVQPDIELILGWPRLT